MRTPAYRSDRQFTDEAHPDAYNRPAFPVGDRIRRQLWSVTWLLLGRLSARPMHRWRAFLLRCFGATLGSECHIYPGARIWAPWNLRCADHVAIGDAAEIYNPSAIEFGSHAIVSQGAYICGATHDYNDPAFPLLSFNMRIGAFAWVCARASVAPGVSLGDGAVLGLASVATRNLEPWTVYAGAPAAAVRLRQRQSQGQQPDAAES